MKYKKGDKVIIDVNGSYVIGTIIRDEGLYFDIKGSHWIYTRHSGGLIPYNELTKTLYL